MHVVGYFTKFRFRTPINLQLRIHILTLLGCYAAQHPRRAKTLFTPRRKPEITYSSKRLQHRDASSPSFPTLFYSAHQEGPWQPGVKLNTTRLILKMASSSVEHGYQLLTHCIQSHNTRQQTNKANPRTTALAHVMPNATKRYNHIIDHRIGSRSALRQNPSQI
jgi:hypothetical protein